MPPKTARRPAPAAVSTMDAARPWLRGLVLLLASLIVFNWFYGTIGRSDFWWHLKTGQYIWQHHALPFQTLSPIPRTWANRRTPAKTSRATST